MKKMGKEKKSSEQVGSPFPSANTSLQNEAVRCRLIAREFALRKSTECTTSGMKEELVDSLNQLLRSMNDMSEIDKAASDLKRAAGHFRESVLQYMDLPLRERRTSILASCDSLRYVQCSCVHRLINLCADVLTACFSLATYSNFFPMHHRDVLRDQGVQVNDSVSSRKKR